MGLDRLWGRRDQGFLRDPKLNPAGIAGERVSVLQQHLGQALRAPQPQGFASALDALENSGQLDQGAENLDLAEAERKRQMLQQDISQRSAYAGTGGALGTAAVGSLADAAGATEKDRIRREGAMARSQEQSADVANILQGIFLDQGLGLAASRIPAQRNNRPSTGANFAGALGSLFSIYGRAAGAGG